MGSNSGAHINAAHINNNIDGFFTNINPFINPLLNVFNNFATHNSNSSAASGGSGVNRIYTSRYPRF